MDQEKEKKSKNKPIMPVSISYIKKLIQLAKENQISCLEVANVKIVNGLIEIAPPATVVPATPVLPAALEQLKEEIEPGMSQEEFKDQMELLMWNSSPGQVLPKLRQVK